MVNGIKYNCIFGGGGVRGLCYVGALKALKEYNIPIESIAGSSVGAVFAALFAVGYDYNEIKNLFLNFNFNMFRDLNINLFNADFSISKGEIFLEWLREKIEYKVFGENKEHRKVKFKDLKTDLQILTLDLSTNSPYIFSKKNTPNEEVAFAVRISAGLPGLMKPVSIGESVLVDGDLIKSWPAWKIYDSLNTSDRRILEFRLEGSKGGKAIKNPMDYINSVISTIWYLSTEDVFNTYHENDRYDFIIIDTKDIILFDFTIDKDTREMLIDKGYKETKHYLKNVLKEKKNNILTVYKKILANLLNLRNTLNQKNPDNVMCAVNQILSSMYEDTKFIDISVYYKIKELKEYILLNIKNDFLFVKKIDNIKMLRDRNDFIIMLVEERIEDLKSYINNF